MIEVKRVFPECNADTLLSELILKRGTPAHYKGVSKVSKALKKYENAEHFIIGVIDTDKFQREDNYILEFTETVENKLIKEGLIIKKLPKTNKHLIRIDPEFEPWMWKIAKECGINPKTYGYNSLTEFYKASKREEVVQNKNFKKMINDIIKANPPAIQTLRKWLEKVF